MNRCVSVIFIYLIWKVVMACEYQCYQLVPYEPESVNSILPTFHQERRSFKLAGKEWIIRQQWADVGVASVVWEAVSYILSVFANFLFYCIS